MKKFAALVLVVVVVVLVSGSCKAELYEGCSGIKRYVTASGIIVEIPENGEIEPYLWIRLSDGEGDLSVQVTLRGYLKYSEGLAAILEYFGIHNGFDSMGHIDWLEIYDELGIRDAMK